MPSREYYLKNKDSLNEYAKRYYQEHKHENPSFVKIECSICGGTYCLMNTKQHLRTKKHQNMVRIIGMEKMIEDLTKSNQNVVTPSDTDNI